MVVLSCLASYLTIGTPNLSGNWQGVEGCVMIAPLLQAALLVVCKLRITTLGDAHANCFLG